MKKLILIIATHLIYCSLAKLIQKEWSQCGGLTYTGSTQCEPGTHCFRENQWYSQCLRLCPSGWECNKVNIALNATDTNVYFQPEPCVKLWGQCGGKTYTGNTNCENGAQCFRQDEWYSQCLVNCPPGWECNHFYNSTHILNLENTTQRDTFVKLWGQCGGITFRGSTKCENGSFCFKQNEWYSQCRSECPSDWECFNLTSVLTTEQTHTSASTVIVVSDTTSKPTNESGVVKLWGQCDGMLYNGSRICENGTQCFRQDTWYSQCLFSCPFGWECSLNPSHNNSNFVQLWEQCGGFLYNGSTVCQTGSCFRQDEWYSQCRFECPFDWECYNSSINDSPSFLNISNQCISLNGICDGIDYYGPSTCENGTQCYKKDIWFSQCLTSCPAGWECENNSTFNETANNFVRLWDRCGGRSYKGETNCEPGTQCFRQNVWYSQCRFSCPFGWECNHTYSNNTKSLTEINIREKGDQCGGLFYKGETECPTSTQCFKYNEFYSACFTLCPKRWACY